MDTLYVFSQVAVPIRPLLALVERMLTVDGSLPPASVPFMTSLQQESMCSELPTLHSDSLDLLIAIIKSLRRQGIYYSTTFNI